MLGQISQGHRYFGLNRGELYGKPGVWYREWAPGALQLRVIGDFNGWDRWSDPMTRDEFGVWSLFFPDEKFAGKLVHGSRVKVHVVGEDSSTMDRIPAYIRRAVRDEQSGDWAGVYWNPPKPFEFKKPGPAAGRRPADLRIARRHGPGRAEGRDVRRVHATRPPPRRKARLQRRPAHGRSRSIRITDRSATTSAASYGVSSRFGTPDELKHLIDTAHGLGLRVLLDIVHSHAVKNTLEGLNHFDGTDHQYFHGPPRGLHPAWDSLLFDYTKYEVQRFLLSNVRYWLEEYRFDGMRFDGVTSMLYLDHGLGKAFCSYDDYFGPNVDEDAVAYLKMANDLAHRIRPETITISEDVSGMVGMARPVDEGGIGFDYRLAMGVPDYWIKILKEKKDEQWNLAESVPHAAQPPLWRKTRRLFRKPRPGDGRRQDARVSAHGQGHVLAHGPVRAKTSSSTAASRCTSSSA